MPRYAAFLRGVMPTNASMPALRAAFAAAGFADVASVLGSGNLVFTAARASEATLERRAEAAMERELGRTFATLVRPAATLRALLAADPFAAFRLPANAKRVVTFLRTEPAREPALPLAVDGVRILRRAGREVLTAYEPGGKGASFMALLEKTYGKEVTTRTWETLARVLRAADGE